MRPLRLLIRGLRSYRGSCEIDFSGRDLVAIVGDTGAGKSSILEAITYALFNATTWDAGEVKMLIADGVETMAVELEFWADGRRWLVRRSCSRRGYPPPVHELRCLDDPAFVPLDREAAVTAQVERLLGMNHRAFLTAVLLPQGRFQTLLQERAGERARILKGIFRVGELDQVRSLVDSFRQRAAPLAARLEGERAQLPADPAAELQRLEAEAKRLRERRERLVELGAELERLADDEREAERRTAAVREPAERLAGLRASLPVPPAVALDRLRPRLAELAEERQALEMRLRALEEEYGRLTATRTAAASAGEGLEDLQQAVAALERAVSERGRQEEDAERLEARRRELATETERLAAREAALAGLDKTASAAQRAAEAAERAVLEHRDREAMARDALARARRSLDDLGRLQDEEEKRRAELERRRGEVVEHEEQLQEAGAALERARQAEREAQRTHTAAHLLRGLNPGDPCPVCARPLPEGIAVDIAELEPLVRDREAAEQRERAERQAVARALAAVEQAERELDGLALRRERAEEQAAIARRDLERQLPGAALGRDDAELLAPLAEEGQRLKVTAAELRSAAQAARSELDRASAGLDEMGRTLARRRRELREEEERLEARRQELAELLARLPTRLGVGPEEPIEQVLALARDRLAVAREREAAWQTALGELEAARRGVVELEERLHREVDEPRARVERDLAGLRSRLNDCRQALGEAPPGSIPEGLPLERLVEVAEAEEEAMDRILAAAAAAVKDVEAEVAAARSRLAALLAEAGFDDRAHLERELTGLEREMGAMEAALQRARAQVPVVEDLERRLAAACEVRDSLVELHRLLADGQFVRHVIERRQRTLLAVASRVLGDMTQNRFGFSEDFQIVDRLTGQPRSTKTLSGGETFLASLALALALVEIAGRSGGRLGALFLDEGFGALDATALDEALAALERRAGQGQLVAVVSHVRAVAERIETVLEVRKLPGGSQARWRLGDEGERLAAQELEAGLLA